MLDVFKPTSVKGAKPPILVFFPDWGGNIHGNGPNWKKFYDNNTAWAAKNGIVGLLVQRESGSGVAWVRSPRMSARRSTGRARAPLSTGAT